MAKKEHSIDKRWYTNQEAAVYLGCDVKHLSNLRKGGVITFRQEKQGGTPRIYFEKSKLDAYMERNFREIECTEDYKQTIKR